MATNFFLLVFLAFVPAGPYPVFIGTIKLDWLAAIVLFVLSIWHMMSIRQVWSKDLAAGFLLYAAGAGFAATIQGSEWALIEMSKLYVYAAITFLLPPFLCQRARRNASWLLFFTVCLSVYIVMETYNDPLGRRFALARPAIAAELEYNYQTNFIDPNMTHVGMLLGLVIYLRHLLATNWLTLRWWLEMFLYLCIFVASLKLTSRTAVLAFIGSHAVAFAVCLLYPTPRKYVKRMIFPVIILGVCTIIAALVIYYDYLIWTLQRFSTIWVDANSEETGRLMIYRNAFYSWTSSVATFIFGSLDQDNPHNEVFRALMCFGFIGFAGFMTVISLTYAKCCYGVRNFGREFFAQNVLFFFVLFAISTYWQTKIMWVGFLFLYSYALLDESNQRAPMTQLAGSV